MNVIRQKPHFNKRLSTAGVVQLSDRYRMGKRISQKDIPWTEMRQDFNQVDNGTIILNWYSYYKVSNLVSHHNHLLSHCIKFVDSPKCGCRSNSCFVTCYLFFFLFFITGFVCLNFSVVFFCSFF